MTVSGEWAGTDGPLEFPDGTAGLFWSPAAGRSRPLSSSKSFAVPQWLFPHEEGSSVVRLLRASSADALNRLIPSAN